MSRGVGISTEATKEEGRLLLSTGNRRDGWRPFFFSGFTHDDAGEPGEGAQNMEQNGITIDHIRAIVEGGVGRIEERVAALRHDMTIGFKGTDKRIDQQAADIRLLTAQVTKTNGSVIALRTDVDRTKLDVAALDCKVDEVSGRDSERSTEMVDLRKKVLEAVRPRLHKRSTDDPDAPPIVHQRRAIDEGAPVTFTTFKQIWPLLVVVFLLGVGAAVAAIGVILKGAPQ